MLSYYINDIQDVARQAGYLASKPLEPPRIVAPLVNGSYFVNFVYWRWFRFRGTAYLTADFKDQLRDMYGNDAVWSAHVLELHRLIIEATALAGETWALLFPHLRDVAGTRFATAKVADLFRAASVGVIDLAPSLVDRYPMDLVVNDADAHPSRKLHAEVAQRLYDEAFLATGNLEHPPTPPYGPPRATP